MKRFAEIKPKLRQLRILLGLAATILVTKIDYVNDRMVFSLCKISVDGTDLTKLVENADTGSYAAR